MTVRPGSAIRAARPMARAPTARQIDVIIASPRWTRALRRAAAVCRRAGAAALAELSHSEAVEISVLLTTDGAVGKLNRAFRGMNKPTNVLSFPTLDVNNPRSGPRQLGGPQGMSVMLGDIAVAYGVTAREAKAEGKTLSSHLSHLVVHGVLHLLGYDHERDRDALTMERLEKKVLAHLGISDPYALPDRKGPAHKSRVRAAPGRGRVRL